MRQALKAEGEKSVWRTHRKKRHVCATRDPQKKNGS
jgi:hypothetical protein